MSNYQLYRTNVKLGGQMKWDLKLESAGDDLYITDFKLSPVSDYAPFNRYEVTDSINYSILENIKSYFKKIQGSFYQEYIDPSLSTLEPYIISGDEERSQYKDMHNGVYEMGLKRAKYTVHNKQFEFLCPVWLESTPESLAFNITMKYHDKNGQWRNALKKTIHLSTSGHTYHDRFVTRLQEYFQTINPDNKCITIDLNSQESYITGICAETGLVKTSALPSLAYNLLCQERLLMDFDNLILREYENRNMITKQLINFNFVFDLDEFIPASLQHSAAGQDITLDMEVVVDDVVLERRDLDSRYDFIPCKDINGEDTDINVFQELKDYQNVDFTTQNKIQPSIVHWSLANFESYIFNLYPGFGCILDGNKLNKIYQNSPDININPHTSEEAEITNSINWIYWASDQLMIKNINSIKNIESQVLNYYNAGGELNEWACNIRHKNHISMGDSAVPIHICFVRYADTTEVMEEMRANTKIHRFDTEWDSYRFWLYYADDLLANTVLVFVREDMLQTASFKQFYEILRREVDQEHGFEKDWMVSLKKWMEEVIEPSIYRFQERLGYMRADGPSLSKEIQHYKTQQRDCVIRYDGKIKPAMISLEDISSKLYTKEIVIRDDLSDSAYTRYNSCGYEKKYPSIGYYSFQSHDLRDVDGNILLDGVDPTNIVDFPYEYKWFSNSSVIYTEPSLVFHIITEHTTESDTISYIYQDKDVVVDLGAKESLDKEDMKELIIFALEKYYNVEQDKARYIYSLYTSQWDWEYKSLADVKNYIYTIKLTIN